MVGMANVIIQLLGDVAELTGLVIDVALNGPIPFVLVVMAVVLWVISFGLFGYLTVGAILSGIIPGNIGRTPPQQGE
jgi:hypothetical protein